MAAAASKIGERNGRIVVSLDSDGRKYYPKGNFTVALTHEVDAGERSGYICEVIYFTGERLGYVIDRKSLGIHICTYMYNDGHIGLLDAVYDHYMILALNDIFWMHV